MYSANSGGSGSNFSRLRSGLSAVLLNPHFVEQGVAYETTSQQVLKPGPHTQIIEQQRRSSLSIRRLERGEKAIEKATSVRGSEPANCAEKQFGLGNVANLQRRHHLTRQRKEDEKASGFNGTSPSASPKMY